MANPFCGARGPYFRGAYGHGVGILPHPPWGCRPVSTKEPCGSVGERAMPRLAIIVEIEVAPGRRDQFLPLLMAHRARCLKDEAGITLHIDVLVPFENDTKVLSYEV